MPGLLPPYAGRRLWLTTRHGKQQALARPFAARLGLNATGLGLGLASEASFGPHRAMPMLPVVQPLNGRGG